MREDISSDQMTLVLAFAKPMSMSRRRNKDFTLRSFDPCVGFCQALEHVGGGREHDMEEKRIELETQ
jgi:hypothetical protein